MPHFPPPPPSVYVMGTSVSNFRVSNDQVLDNLRVRQPNTMMVPPATPVLIDPNAPSSTVVPFVGPLVGNNDPDTNPSLRSGVAQAGALVYCTTPIANPLGPPFVPGPSGPTGPTGAVDPVDGCFDNRNHLYFSAGKNWIPLANCLENDGLKGSVGPQYSQMYSNVDQNTDTVAVGAWATVILTDTTPSSAGFTNDDSSPNYNITWEGTKPIVAKVVASVSWRMNAAQPTDGSIVVGSIGIGVAGSAPTAVLTQEAALNDDGSDTGSPPLRLPYPRNVTVSGLVSLAPGDAVNLQVIKNEDEGSPPDNIINILRANLSIVALL